MSFSMKSNVWPKYRRHPLGINVIQRFWWGCQKNIARQVAQNQVKVVTDGSFCSDTTFVQTPLKLFLFTLRLRSRYAKGTPELALYASKKLGPYGTPIRL